MHSVQSLPLEEITLNFLETGHTQMECDSMHAAIELAKKNVRVHSQREWYNVIHMARRHKPYVVYQLDFSSFFDLEKVKNDPIVNRNKDTDGACNCQLDGNPQHKIQKRLAIFISVFLRTYGGIPQSCYKSAARTQIQTSSCCPVVQKAARNHRSQKKGPWQLCQTGAIPDDVHEWYNNLPVE